MVFQKGSLPFSLDGVDWRKISKGFLIALAGAALTYATTVFIPALEDSGNVVLLAIAAVASAGVNAAWKYLSDNTKKAMILIAILLGSASQSWAQAQIMEPGKLARIKSLLPEVNDQQLSEILSDPSTIWYTRTEMPAVYQRGGGVSTDQSPMGFSLANANISGDAPDNRFRNIRGFAGNPNTESSFPWSQHPGGANTSESVSDAKFMWLPKKENGQPWPVVTWKEVVPGLFPATANQRASENMEAWNWDFPVGTVFGEVIFQRGPTGDDYVFEIRMRQREANDWGVDIFSPFPESTDLAARITELRPEWESKPSLVRLVNHLTEDRPIETARLTDINRTKRAFDVTTGMDYLPDAGDDKLIAELLVLTKFESRLGMTWREGTNGVDVIAPSTKANWSIVPNEWKGAFVGNDRVGCTNCHNSTGARNGARQFDRGRGWYGSVRGNGGSEELPGIFSFTWTDPAAITGNARIVNPPVRPAFIQAGVVERFSSARHPAGVYPFNQ